jgi:hypothetical protein
MSSRSARGPLENLPAMNKESLMRTDQDGSFSDTLHDKEKDLHSYLFFTTGRATDLTLTV